jgi:hypothetical protein
MMQKQTQEKRLKKSTFGPIKKAAKKSNTSKK